MERLKLLDCNRKAVLGLPNAAFKLWVCYYMSEDEAQESWLSIPEIKAQTGLSKTSIIEWTEYLVRTGWLIDTGKTAADKWIEIGKQPTVGAHQIHVYRCDDPTKAQEEKAPVQMLNQSGIPTGSESCHKVLLGSGSGSASVGVGVGFSSIPDPASGAPSSKTESAKRNPKPETKTQTSSGVRTKKCAKDGEPYPSDFDSWPLEDRLAWSGAHNKVGPSAAREKTKPENPTSDDIDAPVHQCSCSTVQGDECQYTAVKSKAKLINKRNPSGKKITFWYCQNHWDEYERKGWL